MITTFFLDVGGVLLTNGWDRQCRKRAAEQFSLDYDEMESRHNLTFDTYEAGKITLDEYLERVVFYKKRSCSMSEFKKWMFAQSQPFDDMIALICDLKQKFGLKIAVVSNEGRELTEYRIKKFNLARFIDFFISSCFVHLRKPDADIYRMALDIAQVVPSEVVYIEDRPMFVQVAEGLGIKGLLHTEYQSTQAKLAALLEAGPSSNCVTA